MRNSTSRRILGTAVAVIMAVGLAACQPTGNPRCDTLGGPVIRAESMGYHLRCDASFPGVSTSGSNVLGWADHKTHTVWLWPDKMRDDRVLRKVAWHELGHVAWEREGRHGTEAAEERWADGYSYCADPIPGVGYAVRPSSCASYR